MNWRPRLRNWGWVTDVANLTVLCDACVLYPAPLRDLLMHLAVMGLFRPQWTPTIHEEWIRNVLINRPDLKPEQLQRTRALMEASVPDGLITGYEQLIETVALPDPDDRHVLAAAIFSGANTILTFNFKDFPETSLKPYGIEALHPDNFLIGLFETTPTQVCIAVKRHRLSLKNPPKGVEDYLTTMNAQRLTQFVSQLQTFTEWI